MKKRFSVTLITVLVTAFFLATGSAYAKKLPRVTWRMQAAFPAGKAVDFGNIKFKGSGMATFAPVFKRVAERTNGRFRIKVYEPGVLFGAKDFYNALNTGAVEMIYAYGWYYSGHILVGKMDPGVFFMSKSGKEVIPLIFESDWLKIIREAYAKHNMFYMTPSAWGGKAFLTNFPITKMSDFKGKLMRGVGPEAEMLKLFGAKVTYVSPAEIYTALQRGTVDGVGYSVSVSAMKGWMEVYKYATWPSYFDPNMTSFVANLDAWNKLPKEYQDILMEEMMKTARWTFEVANDALDEWALNVAIPKHGVKVTHLSKSAREEMMKAQLPIWEKYAERDEHCAQLLKLVKEFQAKQ